MSETENIAASEATPMPPPAGAEPSGAGQDISSDTSSLREHAAELTERRTGRPGESEPIEVKYQNPDQSTYDRRASLKGDAGLHRAADDISKMRSAIGERKQEEDNTQTRAYQEGLRAGLRADEAAAYAASLAQPQQTTQTQTSPAAQVEWPQNANQQPQQQVDWNNAESIKAASPAIEAQRQQYYDALAKLDEAIVKGNQEGADVSQLLTQRQQVAEGAAQLERSAYIANAVSQGYSPAIALACSHPEVHAALTNEINNVTQHYRHNYNMLWSDAQKAQQVLYAAVISQCPELQHVAHDANQLEAVLQTLDQQNPQRAAEIRNGLARLRGGLANVQQLHQAAWQANIDQFKREAQAQDKLWESWNPDLASNPAKATEVANQTASMLMALGLTHDDIRVHYNSNTLMRSAQAQQVLRWASNWYHAIHSANSRRVRPTPPKVLKPGSTADRATPSEIHHSDVDKALNMSGSIRDATKLLLARRAGRAPRK